MERIKNIFKKNTSSFFKKSGFTLIEVMIAIVILSFISLGIYQAMTNSFHLRKVLSSKGSFYLSTRLALRVVERDFQHLFQSTSFLPSAMTQPSSDPLSQLTDAPNLTPEDLQAILEGEEENNSQFWAEVLNRTGLRPTRFLGEAKKVLFISASHDRIYQNTPESIWIKVRYELKPDTAVKKGTKNSWMLVRSIDTHAFDLEDNASPSTKTYVLLHGIHSWTFRYYHYKKDKWFEKWDSLEEELKDEIPDLIEISFEIKKGSSLNFSGKLLIHPEFAHAKIPITY